MKEHFSSISRLDQAVHSINRIVPPDWLPYYATKKDATILHTLQDVVRDVPILEPLAAATLQNELLEIQQDRQDKPKTCAALSKVIATLPALPESINDEPLFNKHDLFLFGHDATTPINLVQDDVYMHHKELWPLFNSLIQKRILYDCLRYRHEETNSNQLTPLNHAYAKLMREYVVRAILPDIQKMLQIDLPIGTFELHELRSAFRELVGLNPTMFAVSLPLRTTVEQFVKSQKFYDKNTQKPVNVQFAEDCADPFVFIDPGDLFRMTRNLLRDAVTHGEGSTITPIIHIETHGSMVEYSIYSPGHLDASTLKIISKQPYTTQDRGDTPHGYGKVGARKLLTALWESLGASPSSIESLLKNHWSNTDLGGAPFVRWIAPLPVLDTVIGL